MGLFESLGAGVKAVATSLAPAGNTPFSNWGGQGSYVSGGTGYGPGGIGGVSSPGSRDNDLKDIGDLASNGIVSTCVSAIAEAFVSAPPFMEQFVKGKWQRLDSHPLIDLLQNPNPFYGADHLWTATIASEITTGNAFWRVVWNRARTEPVELWWEPHMLPNYDARVFIRDYTLRVDGKPHTIGAAANYDARNAQRIDHAVHFRYQIDRKNPRWGWTPLFAVLREIAGDNVASTYQTAVLKNGATASIFFSIKDGLGQGMSALQMEELVAGVERRLRREGAGRVAGTNLPVDLHKVGFSPEELALDRLPAGYERRVCSNLKVPPMVVGLGAGEDTKTYANYGEAIDDFWQRTIIPVEERKGSELEAQLFRLFGLDRAEYRIGWDRSQIQALQEDETALFTRLESASGGSFLTPNEARERARMPAVDGGDTLRAAPVSAPPQDEIKSANARGWQTQPRDDSGQWTDGAGNLNVSHVKDALQSEGIHESRRADILDQIRDGKIKTKADVLAEIDAIQSSGVASKPKETKSKNLFQIESNPLLKIKKVSEAESTLRQIGVRMVELPNNKHFAQAAVFAVALVKKEGFNLPSMFLAVLPKGKALAYTIGETISLTSARFSEADARAEVEKGWWSQQNIVLHEIGHVNHYISIGSDNFKRLQDEGWDSGGPEETDVAKKVSGYAATEPVEFVTETFSGYLSGKRYDDDVMKLYNHYGGPKLI